jgi:hypothetical protein
MKIPLQIKDLLIASTRRFDLFRKQRSRQKIRRWRSVGCPIPPDHAVKEGIVAAHAAAFGASTLIETGTFLGDMDYAVKDIFHAIYSIELSPAIAQRARRRLHAYPHIQILQGDSGAILPRILGGINCQCIFWLDGHYSSGITAKGDLETPVIQELLTIFAHPVKNHVILIDDARCFDGTHDYPTLDGLRALVAEHRPDYAFSVNNDVIRLHPERLIPGDL